MEGLGPGPRRPPASGTGEDQPVGQIVPIRRPVRPAPWAPRRRRSCARPSPEADGPSRLPGSDGRNPLLLRGSCSDRRWGWHPEETCPVSTRSRPVPLARGSFACLGPLCSEVPPRRRDPGRRRRAAKRHAGRLDEHGVPTRPQPSRRWTSRPRRRSFVHPDSTAVYESSLERAGPTRARRGSQTWANGASPYLLRAPGRRCRPSRRCATAPAAPAARCLGALSPTFDAPSRSHRTRDAEVLEPARPSRT
jgi:hypothetical protein